MAPIRIFYSWQSDRERNVCARFIQLAMQATLEALQPNFAEELVLDSDTAGVAGTPPVSETILKKIRNCDIFVADVSFVGTTPQGKCLPNPNVMTEFGYARGMLADGQQLLVMNTAFGSERDLPFDLAHLRHPLAYNLAEGATAGERRRCRTAFAEKLKAPIEASIKFVQADRASRTIPVDLLAPAFALIGEVEQLQARNDVPVIINGPRLVLRMASAAAVGRPYLEPAKVKVARPLFVLDGYHRAYDSVGAGQWSTFDPPIQRGDAPNPEARWYTRLVAPGIIEAVVMIGARIDDDPTIAIEGFPLEGRVVELARRFAKIFAAIGQDGPLAISASLHGLEQVQLIMTRWSSRPLQMQNLFLGTASAASAAGVTPEVLRPMLDMLWLGCGFEEGSISFQSGTWHGDVIERGYEPVAVGGRAWR